MKSFGPRFHKHRLQNWALAGVLGTCTATLALATPVMPDFKAADSNSDGLISLEEFAAQGGQIEDFLESDANQDRRLSSDEYVKASASKGRVKG